MDNVNHNCLRFLFLDERNNKGAVYPPDLALFASHPKSKRKWQRFSHAVLKKNPLFNGTDQRAPMWPTWPYFSLVSPHFLVPFVILLRMEIQSNCQKPTDPFTEMITDREKHAFHYYYFDCLWPNLATALSSLQNNSMPMCFINYQHVGGSLSIAINR